jgi:hypothetical protein
MARHNMLLGQARGKVGSLVFSRLKGKQIIRSKAAEVANPRTYGQKLQRALFATATVAGKFLNDLVDHTFDTTVDGADDRNRFTSLNVAKLRTMLSNGDTVHILEKGGNAFAPNAFIISEGDQGAMPILSGGIVLKGHSEAGNTVITFNDLKQLYPKAKPGTQFTFVAAYTNDQDVTPAKTQFVKCRFTLGQNVSDNTVIFDLDGMWLNAAALDDEKTEGFGEKMDNDTYGDVYNIDASSNPITFNVENDDLIIDSRGDWVPAYKGVIITNLVDGVYKHSNCTMQLVTDFAWTANADAIASYGNVAKIRATSSEYYADQATEDAGIVSYGSLNEAISGSIQSQGYQPKSLNLEGSNTYGPIPEGNYVDIYLQANEGVNIPLNSIGVLAGETAVSNLRKIKLAGGGYLLSFPVAFGTATSIQYNVTFDVTGAVDWENMGFRATVSKVQG